MCDTPEGFGFGFGLADADAAAAATRTVWLRFIELFQIIWMRCVSVRKNSVLDDPGIAVKGCKRAVKGLNDRFPEKPFLRS